MRRGKHNETVFSDKQIDFFGSSEAFVNLAEGAVRSGKTYVCLHRFVNHALFGPPGDLMILGRTKETIERNVITELKNIFPIRYITGRKVFIGDREISLVGANDEQAYTKIRGATLAGAYLNELTVLPESVLIEVVARCSADGAQIWADTNPDSPYHWVMQNLMRSEKATIGDFMSMHFDIDDNLTLSERYKDSLKNLYTGVVYRRKIDGDWVAAEGAIYQMFTEGIHTTPHWPASFSKVIVGVDYGTANASAFLMLGQSTEDQKWYCFREYYWDSRRKGKQKTDGEYATDLKVFLKGDGYPDPYGAFYPNSIEIDPSAASFRLECKKQGINRVKEANNAVFDGIHNVANGFEKEDLIIHDVCENTIMEAPSYVWDEKSGERGVERPLKEGAQDHALDALRYAWAKANRKALTLVATA